jgi:hypothetical protein
MKDLVMQRIQEWATAMDAVKDNTDLLLKDHMKYGGLCAERMRVLGEAEDAMLSLADCGDLPASLRRYIRAKDDRACGLCWTSSSMKEHPECAAKIHEYFSARENLVEYARTHRSVSPHQ